jgi:hypothetical protein
MKTSMQNALCKSDLDKAEQCLHATTPGPTFHKTKLIATETTPERTFHKTKLIATETTPGPTFPVSVNDWSLWFLVTVLVRHFNLSFKIKTVSKL